MVATFLGIPLCFFAVWFIVFICTKKYKIANIIHGILFVFFVSCFSLGVVGFVFHKPRFLFDKIQNVRRIVNSLSKKSVAIKKSQFPTKEEIFFTYCKLKLHSILGRNDKDFLKETIFGFDIIFFLYEDLFLLLREIFIGKDYYVFLDSDAPTIIDCGSNIGLSIIFFKMLYPNSEVVGFEGHPKNFQALKKNIETSRLSNVTLINKAVYNFEGTVAFSRANDLLSRVVDKKQEDFIYVNSVLLSNYINKPIDLLKLDIEGAETEVIEELSEHNKLKGIKNIITEFHHYKDGENVSKILTILEKEGFSVQIKKGECGSEMIYAQRQTDV